MSLVILQDRANSQLDALLTSRRAAALKAARKAATAPRGPPSAAAFSRSEAVPATDLASRGVFCCTLMQTLALTFRHHKCLI